MCGIFGCLLNRPLSDTDIALCRAGRDALRHRGPDSHGEWMDIQNGVYLGHTRLSILDLSESANQPMRRGRHVIVHNGEIYNFPYLRKRLENEGVSFESRGDTEVLLRAWEVWKEKTLEIVDGMFAFTIWDGEEAYVCMDPFGEKQLYWAETESGVYLSSEIQPLARLLHARPGIPYELLTAYMSLGYIPAPATAYKNIYRLPAANMLKVRNGRIVCRIKYWEIPVGTPGRGKIKPPSENDLDRILDAITRSLEGRLLSDVPLCLFLSSGVDSPLIASIARRELGKELACLTVSFPKGNVVNEAPMAARIAQWLGSEFNEIESDEDPSQAGAKTVLGLFGQPNDNVTILPCYQISKAARRRYKVGITGMGGDEVVYGYDKHAFLYRYRYVSAAPEVVRFAIARLIDAIAPKGHRVSNFPPLFGVHDWEIYLANKNFPAIAWLRKLHNFRGWASEEFHSLRDRPELAVPVYEISEVLQNSHLPAFDLGSMRASFELRTPFLNRKILETIATFDPRIFMAFGQKQILRRLLERYLPKEIMDRRKLGFVFPPDRFIMNHGQQTPEIDGISKSVLNEAWGMRNQGRGWNRICIRLILLAEFFSGSMNDASIH